MGRDTCKVGASIAEQRVLRNTYTIFQLILYDERNYSNDSSSTEPPSLLANFLPRVKGYLLSYNNNYFRAKFGGGFEQQTVHPAMALSKPVRKPLQELNGKTGTVKRGRGQNTRQKCTMMIVDSEELDGSGDEHEE